jgi:uncharacterized protein (TIGR02117 family)
MFRRLYATLLLLLAASGCASGDRSLYPVQPGQESADIVVLDNGWHTALIVRYGDLPDDLRRLLHAFAGSEYLAFGWGDEGFFRASQMTAGLVPQALFYSRGSVLLVAGFDGPPEEAFESNVDIYRIRASQAGLERMIDHIRRSFRRKNGEIIDAGPGPDDSRFYLANGRYGWNHTCNQWTAAALKNAGLPITPAYAALASNLEFQIRQLRNVQCNGRPIVHPRPDRATLLARTRGGRP